MCIPSLFESSVNSYDSQTCPLRHIYVVRFESSVNSYDSQTDKRRNDQSCMFESSVNSYDSQTQTDYPQKA